MKGLVIIGHPARPSFSHALADHVAGAWRAAGLEVAAQDLSAIGFDPMLTQREARGAASQDASVQAQIAALLAADFLAIIHPVMWGMPPAVLKGWVDRVFAPGVAYGFAPGAVEADGAPAIGLLRLRHALVLCTSNAHPLDPDPLEMIWRETIFGFCGVRQVTYRCFAPVVPNTDATRQSWLQAAAEMARDIL